MHSHMLDGSLFDTFLFSGWLSVWLAGCLASCLHMLDGCLFDTFLLSGCLSVWISGCLDEWLAGWQAGKLADGIPGIIENVKSDKKMK